METPIESKVEHLESGQLEIDALISKRWLEWNPLCQPACDGCWKNGGYQRRSIYLKEWVSVYVENEELIRAGKAIMPFLEWKANREASKGPSRADICQLHEKKGPCPNFLIECSCPLAIFIKHVWVVEYETNADALRYGAEEIVGTFVNLRKNKLRSISKKLVVK